MFKKYRYLLLGLLILGICVGKIYESSVTGRMTTSVLLKPKPLPFFNSFFTILIKNTLAYFLLIISMFVGKYFIYCFFFMNGMNIGMFIHYLTLTQAAILFLPHGVFEYLAYYILALTLITKLESVEKIRLKQLMLNMCVGYGFLCLGAVIEVAVTPILARLL